MSTRPSAGDPSPSSTGRNLPVAILSGVILAGAVAGALLISPWVFLALVFGLVVLALTELDGALRTHGWRPATPVAVGAGAIMIFGALAVGEGAQSLGLVLLLLGSMAWTLLDTARHTVGVSLGATLLVGVWVPFLASFFGLLLARADGLWFVGAVIAFVVAGDIAAYAVGKGLGRHQLAPTISPSKTWEGTVGGWLVVLVLALAATLAVPGFQGELLLATVFGLAVAVAGTVGDLAESVVKRDLGIKDMGRMMPGHGGIMDRVDAILFALPAAHFTLAIFGVS